MQVGDTFPFSYPALLFSFFFFFFGHTVLRHKPFFQMFNWTLGSTVVAIVMCGLSFTRFLSFGCRAVAIEVFCGTAGLITTVSVAMVAFIACKVAIFYCVLMMRREIDHTVAVIDESASSRAAPVVSSPVPDPNRTYGSTDSLEDSISPSCSGSSSAVVPLQEYEDRVQPTAPENSVLGPRLYMNEAQRELYETGVRKFNAKPKRAIEFVLQSGLLEVLLTVRTKLVSKTLHSSPADVSVSIGGEETSTATTAGTITSEAADAIAIMLSDGKVISPHQVGILLGSVGRCCVRGSESVGCANGLFGSRF